jgi:hypothetical protein
VRIGRVIYVIVLLERCVRPQTRFEKVPFERTLHLIEVWRVFRRCIVDVLTLRVFVVVKLHTISTPVAHVCGLVVLNRRARGRAPEGTPTEILTIAQRSNVLKHRCSFAKAVFGVRILPQIELSVGSAAERLEA